MLGYKRDGFRSLLWLCLLGSGCLPLSWAQLRFALMPKSTNNPFFDFARSGCVDGARVNGVECLWVGPEEENAEEQARMAVELIESGSIDGLGISVTDTEVMTPVIAEARALGIPVVTFDSDAEESERQAYIGTNNFFFGEQLGKLMTQLWPHGGTYSLLGTQAPNIQERIHGFHHAIAAEAEKEGGSKWFEIGPSPGDYEANLTLAMEKMQEFAEFNPTAIVPVMGAPMRSGTWIEFVLRNQWRNITLVSGDAMPNQLEMLDRGYVQGLIGQLPYEMGQYSIETLLRLSRNETFDETVIGTNVLSHVKIPLVLPILNVDHNLIGELRSVGYILFALVAITAMAVCFWTFWCRHIYVVKASQPVFLAMVAIGMILLSSSIVPLSFDDGGHPEAQSQLRAEWVCMSIPWLGCVGFSIAFSALFAKTLRINRIFHSQESFARVKVTERDVFLPLIALLMANVVVLAIWTALDPLTYVRIPHEGTDGWNRVISTYGSCRSNNVVPYLVPLVLINVSVLLLANWQAYEARHIEIEFSESKYIGITIASMLQASLMGVPILFIVRENPQAFYLVFTFMIFVICMATLLLIFAPKIVLTENFRKLSTREQRRLIRTSIEQTHRRQSPLLNRASMSFRRNANDTEERDDEEEIDQAVRDVVASLQQQSEESHPSSQHRSSSEDSGQQGDDGLLILRNRKCTQRETLGTYRSSGGQGHPPEEDP